MEVSGGSTPTLASSKRNAGDHTPFKALFPSLQLFLARDVFLKKTPTYPHFVLLASVVLAFVRSGSAAFEWR